MIQSAALPDAAALLARADECRTPCGEGTMVWRLWGSGRPLVLLHGGSGSWNHWVRNIEPLAASGRRLFVADLPGFGDSATPAAGNDADAVVEPVLDGLRAMLGTEPVDVVAFSFGSLVAALGAAAHPERFARLVIVGAPVRPLVPPPFKLRPWAHLQDEEQRRAIHRHNLSALMLARPESITEQTIDLHAQNLGRDRMRERRLTRTDAMARALEQIECPLTVIYGREDALYRGRWPEVEAQLRALPRLRSLRFVEGAGHWVQYEDPAAFHASLLDALG
jgi:2-hydroxy-6-oxonona-2,4-dienedioate hydrolase